MKERSEIKLLRIFRSMTDEQREIFIEQGKAFLKSNTKHKNIIDYKKRVSRIHPAYTHFFGFQISSLSIE